MRMEETVAWGIDTHLSTVPATLLASPLECTRAVLPGSHLVSRKTICPSPIQLSEEFCKNVKPDHGVPLLKTLQGSSISRRPKSKLLWCPRRLQTTQVTWCLLRTPSSTGSQAYWPTCEPHNCPPHSPFKLLRVAFAWTLLPTPGHHTAGP